MQRWELPKSRKWSHCQLLENGDLLVIGLDHLGPSSGMRDSRYLALFDFEGELKWKRRLPIHHDLDPSRPGTLLALTDAIQVIPAVNSSVPVKDTRLTMMTREGIVLEEKSLYDILNAGPFPFEIQEVAVERKDRRLGIDLFHANSIAWMPHPDLQQKGSLYNLDHVLVSIRHQDSVVILNWKSGKLVWAWGQGKLSGPHDATWLENGNILVFDNGMNRGWSRVVEIDPLLSRIVWQYPAEPEDFFTLGRGSSERLQNGNTLIAESDRGHAFEVTLDGRKIWDFWSPHFNAEGHRATIV